MLEDHNPWWTSKERIEEVEVFGKYMESEVKWEPDVLEKVSLNPTPLTSSSDQDRLGSLQPSYSL